MEITPPSPPPSILLSLEFLFRLIFEKENPRPSLLVSTSWKQLFYSFGEDEGKGEKVGKLFFKSLPPFPNCCSPPRFSTHGFRAVQRLPQERAEHKEEKGGETKQKQQQQQQRQNGISFMTLQLLERKRKQELSVQLCLAVSSRE